MDNQFITTEYLKEISLINGNVEDSKLKVVIQRVQRSIVRPLLGYALYERLNQGITDDDLTTDEKLLMDKYIIPVISIGCDRKSINAITYDIRNKTVGKAKDEHIDPVNESENLRLDNDIRQDLAIAQKDLTNFLYENADTYPLFKEGNDRFDEKPTKRAINRNIGFA